MHHKSKRDKNLRGALQADLKIIFLFLAMLEAFISNLFKASLKHFISFSFHGELEGPFLTAERFFSFLVSAPF